jgi:hypothetical protein
MTLIDAHFVAKVHDYRNNPFKNSSAASTTMATSRMNFGRFSHQQISV